jgi:hypothetical protein
MKYNPEENMKSLKKMAELADRFEAKLRRKADVQEFGTSEDPKAPVIDAFFDKPNTIKQTGYEKFYNQIAQQDSNFMALVGKKNLSKVDVSIGASVNLPAGTADFVVSSTPPIPQAELKAALVADYKAAYGAEPSARIKAKKEDRQNPLRPPNLVASIPGIMTIGLG